MNITEFHQKYSGLQVQTDSRTANANGIFFALRGERFDGNKFAAQALSNGARYAVVDDPSIAADERYIVVDNALQTLQMFARRHRQMMGTTVIGLTGTNGKTTTKELINSVLSQKFNIIATEGNLNNQIGVPLTLLKITPQTQIAVIEMGASHSGDIRELCDIALPDFGLITNIGKAHLEGFGNAEGVRQTKKELYDYLEQHSGTAFYRSSNPVLTDLVKTMHVKAVAYESLASSAIVAAAPFLHLSITVNGKEFDVPTHLAGTYNSENVMAAVCVGLYFGVEPQAIAAAIAAYKPSNSRSQLTLTASNKLILDAYNANPSSMSASLQNFFDTFEGEHKMAILGDMLELGEASLDEHRAIVDMLTAHPEIEVILVGKNFSEATKGTAITVFETGDALREYLMQHPPRGKTILVKGSHSMKMEQLSAIL